MDDCVSGEGDPCTPVRDVWVDEICNAASVAIWDGTRCIQTCFGCCGCEPFCDLTFETVEVCEAACLQ